jgi:hypothetical protein
MSKIIGILQPNYIPWKGVFDLINQVDIFVFYDDVQYTTKDWRNRNKIKTKDGLKWLTVPIIKKGLRHQLISEAKIDNSTNWQSKHYKTLISSYSKSPYIKDYEYLLEEIYLKKQWTMISDLNITTTVFLAKTLGIKMEWYKSSEFDETGSKDGEKVIKICQRLGCNHFINGPASRKYMNEELFSKYDVSLSYIDYQYPEYPQLHGSFCHKISVLDLLFNCGPKALDFIINKSS